MQFNNHSDDQDIVTEILKICNATTNTYTLKDLTRRFNAGMDRYVQLAFEADGRWPFDSLLENSPPIDTQNIVSGTNRYKFDTFTEKIINLLRIEVLDADANGMRVYPESIEDLHRQGTNFEEAYLSSDKQTGKPTNYFKYGDFIYLRPTPDYAETAGLKAYFSRALDYLASTATTTIPGVPEIHHWYLCRYAALQYLIDNNLPQANAIAAMIQEDERKITDYFGRRDEDDEKVLSTALISFK